MIQTAAVLVSVGPAQRPRSVATLGLADEAFQKLTGAPRVGLIRFTGYATPVEIPVGAEGRFARFEADFEVS